MLLSCFRVPQIITVAEQVLHENRLINTRFTPSMRRYRLYHLAVLINLLLITYNIYNKRYENSLLFLPPFHIDDKYVMVMKAYELYAICMRYGGILMLWNKYLNSKLSITYCSSAT